MGWRRKKEKRGKGSEGRDIYTFLDAAKNALNQARPSSMRLSQSISLFTGALVNAFRVVGEGGEWESSRGGVLRVGDYRPSLLWL